MNQLPVFLKVIITFACVLFLLLVLENVYDAIIAGGMIGKAKFSQMLLMLVWYTLCLAFPSLIVYNCWKRQQ